MQGNISFMFDYWTHPVVHLLLLKTFPTAKVLQGNLFQNYTSLEKATSILL